MFPRAKYKDSSEVHWPELTDPVGTIKYDGASFFMQIGPDGSPRYYSRRKSVKGHFPDRTDQLPQLSSKKMPFLAGNVYNVELIHTGRDPRNVESHPKLSGILNSLPARAIQTQHDTGPVRAVLLDVVEPHLQTYQDKLVHLKHVQDMFGDTNLMYMPTPAVGVPNIMKLVERTKKTGREGVIVTSLTKPETSNSRVRVKHVNTYNLRVIKVQQEVDIYGKPKNSMGALIVADATGREVAAVGTGFTQKEREEIWNERAAYPGRDIQVKTFGTVKEKGRLRGPVYNGESDGELDVVN